jgi:hypothetical protein
MELSLDEGIGLRILGRILLAAGEPAPGIAAFDRSLELLTDNDPYEAARTQVQYGLALLRGTASTRGQSLLQKAHETFQALGAQHDLIALDALLGNNQGS